jgi:two-component system, NtrC family, nitrogen regulation sensor histidine kinase NtrY
VHQPSPTRTLKTSSRKRAIILLAIAVLLLLAILVSQNAFDPNFLRPGNNEEILVFWALTFLISLLFVALTFVLFRNLLKLFAERRMGVLGSKFRTRMVAGALLLSFVPVVVMYWFAYGLMNRSIERWFSTPAEEVRSDIHAMGSLLANYATRNAHSEALVIASSAEAQEAFSSHDFSELPSAFQRHDPTLQGGFALAVQDGHEAASFHAPAPWALLRTKLPLADAAAGRVAQFTWGTLTTRWAAQQWERQEPSWWRFRCRPSSPKP